MKLGDIPVGQLVLFPYSGKQATVLRHGNSGTVIRPVGERQVRIAEVEFVAPLTPSVVSSGAEVVPV